MKKQYYIREMNPIDLPQIKSIIDENQMFPSEYLDEMTKSYFDKVSQEFWIVAVNIQNEIIGVAFCSPEQMTDGTWNLLLIAVLGHYQGQGIGKQLVQLVGSRLKNQSARVLLVETSGLPKYEQARRFYPACDFKSIARIPDYYDKGDDKVVFWKSLSS